MNSNQYSTTKQNGTLLIRFLCAGALLCTVTAPDLSYAKGTRLTSLKFLELGDPQKPELEDPKKLVRQALQKQIAEEVEVEVEATSLPERQPASIIHKETKIITVDPKVSMRDFINEMSKKGGEVISPIPNSVTVSSKRKTKAKQVGLPFPGGKYEDPEGNLSLMLGNGPLPGTGKIKIPGIDGVIKKGFEVKQGDQTYTIFPISNKLIKRYSKKVDAVMVCGSIKDGVGKCIVHQIPGSTAGSAAIVNESLTAFKNSNANNDVILKFSKNNAGQPIVTIGEDTTTVYTHQSVAKRMFTAGKDNDTTTWGYDPGPYDSTGGSGIR